MIAVSAVNQSVVNRLPHPGHHSLQADAAEKPVNVSIATH